MPDDDPTSPPPHIGAPEPELGGRPNPFPDPVRRSTPLTADTVRRDADPTAALACLDCETSWLGKSEWGYCPLCGTELTELEVRADD